MTHDIPYRDYATMAEAYLIEDAANFIGISMDQLELECGRHDVVPRLNEIGEWILTTYDVRKIHHALYHSSRGHHLNVKGPWGK